MILLVNPAAGAGRARLAGQAAAQLLRERGVPFAVWQTRGPDHARHLAQKAAARGERLVLVTGGDGTLWEAAQGLMGTPCALGILPAGSGNYLARALGLPRQMEAALHRALTGPRRAMDVGLADGTPFFNLCGTGFDVATLEYAYAARRRLGGRAAYLWGVLRSAARYRGRPMTVEVDGRVFVQGPLLLAAVANGGYLGGGIPVVPSARVDDGLFDILCVRDVPPLARPRYLMGLMRGRIEQFPITLRCRGRRVRLHPAPVRMELDGQIVTLPRGEFTLRPGALWIQG